MKPRIRTVALLISASALAAAAAFVPVKTASAHIRASSCPWLNESLPIKQRVQELVSAMTLPQMFTEMHAIRRPLVRMQVMRHTHRLNPRCVFRH